MRKSTPAASDWSCVPARQLSHGGDRPLDVVGSARNIVVPMARARLSVRLAPTQDPAEARASSTDTYRSTPLVTSVSPSQRAR